MKTIFTSFVALWLITGVAACSPNDRPELSHSPEQPGGNDNPNDNGNFPGDSDDNKPMRITLKIGSSTFTATLLDNPTAKAFRSLLPIRAAMPDLNRNEKYYTLPGSLPTAVTNPGTIRTGDIMLYGSNTLVLFYKTFPTSYAYTPIGSVDDPSGLAASLGTGTVTILFEKAEP